MHLFQAHFAVMQVVMPVFRLAVAPVRTNKLITIIRLPKKLFSWYLSFSFMYSYLV